MNIYQVNCSGIYTDRAEEMGFGSGVIYCAPSDGQAILMAARFLKSRCEAFELSPGCIKVYRFHIMPISETGQYQSAGFSIFEWKVDTSPLTLDDLIDNAAHRNAQIR